MRRTVLIIVCLVFIFTGCTWKRIESGQGDTFANGEYTSVAFEEPTGYPNGTMCLEGYFLKSRTGTPLIIADNSPVAMSVHPDFNTGKEVFDDFTDGDLIKIWCEAVMESYPGQTNIYDIRLMEEGDIENIDNDVLKSLQEMGWLEPNEITIEPDERDTVPDICLPEPEMITLTGYYLEAESEKFIIVENEPIYVYPHPDMVEDVEVLYGYTDGDLIEICCEIWCDDDRKGAQVWSSRLLEEGSIDNISDEAFDTLVDYGYEW